MNIGSRLETIGSMVPQGSVLADIGTDHAYLPVWLIERGQIKRAIAGDIAAGPCQAARFTVAMHNLQDKVEVRMGSGLAVVKPGEVNCITIAGMGASTMISILEADMEVAASADLLVLQPMAGAASLRQWLCENGWEIADEELVDDPPHFYEIICARRGEKKNYSAAQYVVGPLLIEKQHPLLSQQFARQLTVCEQLLANMGRSERARQSTKYQEVQALKNALEVMKNESLSNCK